MASKKSAQYPHQWPDGTWHSVSWAAHQQHMASPAGAAGGTVYMNGQPVTQQQWQSGDFYNALTGSPAGTPVPGPAPSGMPQPPDPAAEAAKRQAIWNTGVAGAEANYQRGETAWGLGYNADGSLNTSNPYSQAQLLQDNYKRSITGTNNSMAAQGQLYSGARLNAQGRNDRLYAEGSSGLRDQARQQYHGIGFGQLSAYGQNMTGVSEAELSGLRTSVYGS